MSNARSLSTGFRMPEDFARPAISDYNAKMMQALREYKADGRLDTMLRANHLDSWENAYTGLGTSVDKTTQGIVLPDRQLTDEELSAIYHTDDMGARMADIIPQEMLREGFSIDTGNPDYDTIIEDKITSLETRVKMGDGERWARAFGGAGILIGADDGQDASEELKPERARDINYLYVIDRRLLWPISYYNELGHPKLGEPKSFIVTTIGGYTYETIEVHESRLILFHGATTAKKEKLRFRGWEMSIYQRAYNILRGFNTGWQAVENLLTDANQGVFAIGGLSEMLRSGGEDAINTRMQSINMFRSVVRALVIDADAKESFTRQAVNFENVPQILDKWMLRLAAAVEIPVTILMGQSPAGMNATGESDFRWFYDRIRAHQTVNLAPKLRRLVDIWLRTKAGRQACPKKIDTLTVKFPPLWSDTPIQQAQKRLALAQADALYMQNQAIMPEEIALSRFRPEGFQDEIVLQPEAVALRERIVNAKEHDDASLNSQPGDNEPEEETKPEDEQVTLELTSTDVATIVTVNEARKANKLPPLKDGDGDLYIPEFKAKHAAPIAAAATAESGEDPNKPKPPPPPHPGAPFGAPGQPHPPPGGQTPPGGLPGAGNHGSEAGGNSAKINPDKPQRGEKPLEPPIEKADAIEQAARLARVIKETVDAKSERTIFDDTQAKMIAERDSIRNRRESLKARYEWIKNDPDKRTEAESLETQIAALDVKLSKLEDIFELGMERARTDTVSPLYNAAPFNAYGPRKPAPPTPFNLHPGNSTQNEPEDPVAIQPYDPENTNPSGNSIILQAVKFHDGSIAVRNHVHESTHVYKSEDHLKRAYPSHNPVYTPPYVAGPLTNTPPISLGPYVNNTGEPSDHHQSIAGIEPQNHMPHARTFHLQRDEDESGVSGTGIVAAGAQFADGHIALRWTTATSSVTMFDNEREMLAVHGHGGKTRAVWHDEEVK